MRGEVDRALDLYVEAGLATEAARLLRTRAERTLDPVERLGLLGRARDLASGETRELLSRRCAEQRLELCKQGVLRLTALELDELAGELMRLESPQLAAEAHALAGNVEDQARALVEAGAIERLEAVLDADRRESEQALATRERALRAYDLDRSGRRREALAMIEGETAEGDPVLRELKRHIESRRVTGPRVVLHLGGEPHHFALGREVVVGRSGSTIEIPSPAISRSHLVLSRDESGPSVRDVSKNGTTLNGIALDTTLRIGQALTLELGGEVTVRLAPDPKFCLRVELLDEVLYAPLAGLRLAVGVVELGTDGWLELVPGAREVYLGDIELTHPVQLCRGDRFLLSRGGAVVVGVES